MLPKKNYGWKQSWIFDFLMIEYVWYTKRVKYLKIINDDCFFVLKGDYVIAATSFNI